MKEYMQYVNKVRELAKTLPLEQAVSRAIEECIKEGVMSEFLTLHKSEIRRMSLYEFDEEAYMQVEREVAFEEGLASAQRDIEREKQRADALQKELAALQEKLKS